MEPGISRQNRPRGDIKVVRERHHQRSGKIRIRDPILGMPCTPATRRWRPRERWRPRQRKRRMPGKARMRCGGTNEVGGGSVAATGSNGSSVKCAEGSSPVRRCYRCGKKGHTRAISTEKLCSRCNGRGHTPDICPTSIESAVLVGVSEGGAKVDVDKDGTV